MCCCCCRSIHRHQIHLISYGFVAFILILTGLVFTIFAIFQKDSQIGKIWLAGPTTMVVGLVLCGKVMIDWTPAMYRGRHNSIESMLEEQMALMTPRSTRQHVPLISQDSVGDSLPIYIKCQNINCNCPHHIKRSPTAYVNQDFINSTPLSIHSHRNMRQDSPSSNSTIGTKSIHNKFSFNQIPSNGGLNIRCQENNEIYQQRYNYETLSNKSTNMTSDVNNSFKNDSYQLSSPQNRRFSCSFTQISNVYPTGSSKMSLHTYGSNKISNSISNNSNNNDPTVYNFYNLSQPYNKNCRNSKHLTQRDKPNESCCGYQSSLSQGPSNIKQKNFTTRVGGRHPQILSTVRSISPMPRCIPSSLVVTPEPSTIEKESLCNSTFSHNYQHTQEYDAGIQDTSCDNRKEGTSSTYSTSSVVSGNEILNNENHSCYQGETFIINEQKYLI
uniref:Transmembrane protein 220 n=1 Tax=Parastrongyloides trichosuri TaxID=131310 RepID=A0A0N4ZBW1_PARTI